MSEPVPYEKIMPSMRGRLRWLYEISGMDGINLTEAMPSIASHRRYKAVTGKITRISFGRMWIEFDFVSADGFVFTGAVKAL